MFKICKICNHKKNKAEFYGHLNTCKSCYNFQRMKSYKESICRHCNQSFHPGVRGRYKFCSEQCRFMAKVNKQESPNCWLWLGNKDNLGYGRFAVIGGSRSALAHRIAYRLFKGAIPEGKLILHKCNNASCVCPDHLRFGTDADNAKDKIIAGNSDKMPKGSNSHFSKLTEEIVKQIRDKAEQNISYAALGRLFNISACQASNIVRRKSWKHV